MSKKPSPELVTTLEQITPAVARQYLARNVGNRPSSPTWVEQLAKMIIDGDWKLTHQGIAFNCDGTLKDGQQRLMAVVRAGRAVPMLVTRGLPNESMPIIDIHRRRTDVDALRIMGIEADTHIVAIATSRLPMARRDILIL